MRYISSARLGSLAAVGRGYLLVTVRSVSVCVCVCVCVCACVFSKMLHHYAAQTNGFVPPRLTQGFLFLLLAAQNTPEQTRDAALLPLICWLPERSDPPPRLLNLFNVYSMNSKPRLE